MSGLKHPLYSGGNSMEGVTYGVKTDNGYDYVLCGNCGNRIKVRDLMGNYRKKCFQCGCIVTQDGTFVSEYEADTYDMYW